MNYPDEKLLATFRLPGFCLLCGYWFEQRDAHHAFLKQGGGGAIDVPENVAGLNRWCHTRAENSEEVAQEVRVKVMQREFPDGRVSMEEVWQWLWLIRRTPPSRGEVVLPPRPWETADARTPTLDPRHRRLAPVDDAQEENDLLRRDLPAGASRLRKTSGDSALETPEGWHRF